MHDDIRDEHLEPSTPIRVINPVKPAWKRSAALAALLIAGAGTALAGDKYDGAFTRSAVIIAPDPDCPSPGLRFTAPHPFFDTLGSGVGTFTGCIVPVDPSTVNFLGGMVTFVYTDGATSTAGCEEWTQVPISSCAVGADRPFRCTFTGGTGRLTAITGFFDVRYFDNSETACGGPGLPDILGYFQGHIQLR